MTKIDQTELPAVGTPFGGGFLGAVYFDDDGRRVGLITAPASSEIEAVFKTSRTADPGARSLHDGLANSEAMNDAEHPAAQHCRSLRIGGKDDWQLPSRRDIYRLAENCMPGAGIVPQQTTAAAFREGGPAAFQRALYWSSTECTSGSAWVQLFYGGHQYGTGKDWSCRVRAVRKCFL
ncbi:Lcl C-terminal domain-containing protein [Ferrovibrio xuzhouensis]|uniref:DUF1566 domain-containing protein n=1 Tax=Ferrovibrio xuzhouensis TaxID=1576914 RepID=A0ABV7VB52_9PROT